MARKTAASAMMEAGDDDDVQEALYKVLVIGASWLAADLPSAVRQVGTATHPAPLPAGDYGVGTARRPPFTASPVGRGAAN